MAIKDLQANQGKVDLTVEIVEMADARTFNKFGKEGRVANAVAQDETGKIKLTLWNEDIDKVGVGDKVHIINGFVSEWQGEKQLSTGRFGKLEVVEKKDKMKVAAPDEDYDEDKVQDEGGFEKEDLEE